MGANEKKESGGSLLEGNVAVLNVRRGANGSLGEQIEFPQLIRFRHLEHSDLAKEVLG